MNDTVKSNIEYLNTLDRDSIFTFMDNNWDDVFTAGVCAGIYSDEFLKRVIIPAIAIVMDERNITSIPAALSPYTGISDKIDSSFSC